MDSLYITQVFMFDLMWFRDTYDTSWEEKEVSPEIHEPKPPRENSNGAPNE